MNRGGTFWKGEGAILLCAFLWSTSGLFIKLLDWHPVVISGMRSLIAALFIFTARLVFPPKGAVKTVSFPFWAAAVCYTFTMLTFITANKLTTSANAIMLQYSAPVWAGLLGWILLREKPRWEHWGALILVIGGMILLFRDGLVHPGAGGLSLAGDILAVVSGMLFGAHSVFLRMMKEGNTSDSLLAAHVINAVLCVPFLALYPPDLSAASTPSIFYMGIVQMGMASLLFSYGIKRISAIGAMLTAMIEPVLNPVWVLAVTGEKPSAHAVAGGGVIIAAIAASTIIGKRREGPRCEKQLTV